MGLNESIYRIIREETETDKNIDGGKLKVCSRNPITGFYRDGYCRTGDDDKGSHTVCSKVTKEFLKFTKSQGNNLDMLQPGDKWCLCAKRWEEANENGVAPKIIRSSTNIKTLDIINSVDQELDEYARTLKNARRQGVGIRFPQSAIKSNPSRFRPSVRKSISEIYDNFSLLRRLNRSIDDTTIKRLVKQKMYDLEPTEYNSKYGYADDVIFYVTDEFIKPSDDPQYSKIYDILYEYIRMNFSNIIYNYWTENQLENDDELYENKEITERCWKGYTQKGMKTMFGKKYPNCVKIKK